MVSHVDAASEAILMGEERFRAFFEGMTSGVAIYSTSDGERFVFSAVNPTGARISKVRPEEVIGREVRDVFPGVVAMGLYDVFRRVWASGEAEVLPTAFYRDDRLTQWYENRVFKLSTHEICAVYDDITARKQAEEALQKSESHFRTLFETMHEGFALHEVICNEQGEPIDYRYLDVNPAFEQLTGLRRETTVGRTLRELLPGIEEEWIKAFGRVALTGEPAELENYVKELGRHYRVRAYSPLRGRFAVVFEDVTAQKQAMLEQEEREKHLRVLLESSYAGIIQVDTSGLIMHANRRMAEMFGCPLEELIGSRYIDHVHPDQRDLGDDRMRRLIRGEIKLVAYERHYVRCDGSDFWGYLSGGRHTDEAGNTLYLMGHIFDITERMEAERALHAQEEQLRLALFASAQGIYDLNVQTGEAKTNAEYATMLGYDPSTFRETNGYWLERLHPDDCERTMETYRRYVNGELPVYSVEFRQRTAAGDWKWILSTGKIIEWDRDGKPLRMLGTHIDITERKKSEEERLKLEHQLLHAQKLESLGVLAGGIAHDFNNILTAIIGNAELARMRLNPESPGLENLKRIEQAAGRAADLARQMLAYSGKGHFVVEAIDLNRLVEEMGHMLEVSISKKVVLRYDLTRHLPAVEADATQIRQVVMNLVINASEAIGDRSGVVAVRTGCMECSEALLADTWRTDQVHEGLFVFLEVSDTGCGMDQETQARIFDPFFTTKFTGRGLGMAAVLGIVRGHRGAITIKSEPGRGSTFKVLLPAAARSAELFADVCSDDTWRGSGTVLLVDDEETVRAIGSEMLRELGFEVVTAADGREALEVYRCRNDITLVLLDLTMPHLDGEECFRALRQLDPGVKVIMSSGFSESEVSRKFAGQELAGFVQKPYKVSDLKSVISALTR